MRKSILYLFVALAIITSCQKDPDVEVSVLCGQSLTVALPSDDATTRVEYTDGVSGVDLCWEEDDKFALYTTTGDYVADFLYASVASNGIAKFTSTSSQVTLTDGSNYIAIFPAIEGATTIDDYDTAFAELLANQTQTGNSDSHHLNNAQRMEAEFTYNALDDSTLTFEHKMASVRIAFGYEDSIPSKVVFNDGDNRNYTLNFEEATEATIYTSYFVIEPNLEGDSRLLTFEIHSSDSSVPTSYFTAISSATYNTGVQYRLTLALSNLCTGISTKEELIAFQESVNSGNVDINAVLLADIDLNGEEWIPIGTSETAYSGTFNGGGYTINNLTINSTNDYQGLFGYINGGSISNLIIENSQVQGGSYTGAICGYSSGTISSCGIVDGSVSGSGFYVGGVVGYTSSSLTSCYNTGSVSGSSSVGGVVGGAWSFSPSSSLVACYNTGSVSGSSSVGGVVGSSSFSLTACYYISGIEYTYGTRVSTLAELNGVVATMNNAAGSNCFTTNSDNILPSLFDEHITYEDRVYIENMNISTVEELKTFQDLVNFGWSPSVATLTANIDLNGEKWMPIGSLSNKYSGTFNGGDHTISNFIINSTNDYQGLFGYVSNGRISNLIVENPQVQGGSYTGAICGYAYSNSAISSCGVVGGSVSGSGDYVGGVVGRASSLTTCYNTGLVSSSGDYVGGVVGCTYSSSLTDCYNIGSVSGIGDYVGGVVGSVSSSSSFTNCYNTGSVSGGGSRVGGVVGYSTYSSSFTSCYNTGSVSGGGSCIGGVVGYSSSSFTNCYNTATVSGNSYVGGVVGDASSLIECYNTGSVSGNSYVGGVVGDASSLIECYNTGSVSGGGSRIGGVVGNTSSLTSCYNTGSVSGSGSRIGGVVGYVSSSLTTCYNTGSVSGIGDYVGGVVGYSSSSSLLSACYNTGSVLGSGGFVGGVVGYAYYTSLTACYNTGSVSGSGDYVGGVVGYSTYYLTACYYISGVEYTYGTRVSTIDELNGAVATMNSAAGSNYFTTNSGNILPSLFDEQITYENKIKADDVTISTAEELKAFRNLVNSDPSYAPDFATLTADIDLKGEEWTPIFKYYGTFDGGGYTISNLTVNSSSSYVGLFGSISGGSSISNLTIENPQVQGEGYAGAICGYAINSTISSCGVVGGSVSGGSFVGGVVGHASSLIECYNTGSVLGSGGYVGGVVGSVSYLVACYNTGSVSGSGNYVGGVVGSSPYTYSYIACYNTGSVSGSGSSVGGVVGYATSSLLSACYFIDQAEDDATGGVGNSTSSSYTYMILSSKSELNAVIDTMNTAAGDTYYEQDTNNVNDGYPILVNIDYQ